MSDEKRKHRLSVGAIFRNEATGIKEWLDHYLMRDVDHFYLVDDDSQDNYWDVVRPYVEAGKVSIFINDIVWPRYVGRQRDMYNKFILPRLNESEWLLVCDLDEFVWTPLGISLHGLLQQCRHLGQVQINHRIFGSNGHTTQPPSLVEGFTRRCRDGEMGVNFKYFVNSDFEFSSLNVHHATFTKKEEECPKYFLRLGYEYFITNHYCCQSREFWNNVKCTRGDGDAYLVRKPEDFEKWDVNSEQDLGLLEQTKSHLKQ